MAIVRWKPPPQLEDHDQERGFGSNILPIIEDNQEVLYDRTKGHAIVYEEILQYFKSDALSCHVPDLPWSFGHIDYSLTNTGRPYVETLVKAVGKCNVPRDLQAIITLEDFVNENSGSDLSLILNNLESHCDIMSSNNAQYIQRLVCNGMNTLLRKLRSTNFALFENVTAVMLGSGAEKTKTNEPDEWDFVIFLPCIWKKKKETFLRNKSRMTCITDIREEQMFWDTGTNFIVKKLQKLVINFLPSCMDGLEFKHSCPYHVKAMPVWFTYKSFDIKLDISFGCREENELSTSSESLIVPLEVLTQQGFYILTSISQDTYAMHTTTFTEVKYMCNLPGDVRQCYKLTKYLIELFIPTETSYGCGCKQSLFPSYRLKLILFYMCKYYDGEKYWSSDQRCNRVIEIFVIYSMCLRYGTINNVFSCFTSSFRDVNPFPLHTSKLNESSSTKCLERLLTMINVCPAYQRYHDVFYNHSAKARYNIGDITSVFCILLYNLKHPSFTMGDYLDCILSPHTDITGKDEIEWKDDDDILTRYGSDTLRKGLQVIQFIDMESRVTCLLMSPDHGGELLVGLWTFEMIKYQYNEVIQRIELPGIPVDMCYYNGTVTVIVCPDWFTMNRLTYNYTDFSLLPSPSLSVEDSEVRCITRLKDEFVVAYPEKSHITKMTANGEIICHSGDIFHEPSELLALNNSVVVWDKGSKSIIFLSTDFQSTLFVYSPAEAACHLRSFCKNDRNGSIFVASEESDKFVLSEISDDGKIIRLEFPDIHNNFIRNTGMCDLPMIYDPFRHSISCTLLQQRSKILRLKLSQ